MTDLGEDTTSNLTSKVVDSVHFAGQRVDTVEGRGLFVEDKDWKLIKAKLDMSSKRGVNGERLWGGIGLAAVQPGLLLSCSPKMISKCSRDLSMCFCSPWDWF